MKQLFEIKFVRWFWAAEAQAVMLVMALTMVIAGGVLGTINIFGVAIGSANEARLVKEDLAFLKEKFPSKYGWSSIVPGFPDGIQYHLFSTNGGKDWYVLGDNDEIIGPADKVYPGLLRTLNGLDALMEAAQHGPIDPTSKEGRKLIEDAGLVVRQK